MPGRTDLDRQLADHVRALDSIERNLVELEMDHAAMLVRATDFTGTTASRHADAVARLGELWEHAALYRAGVRAAVAVTEQEGWLRGDRTDELDYLLNDPVVVVDAATVPVLSRTLTGADSVERRSTLSDLLDAMGVTFDAARHAIAAIDDAWRTVRDLAPRLAGGVDLLARQQPDADPAAVDRARAALRSIDALTLTDPIGAVERLREVDDLVRATAEAADAAATRRRELAARCDVAVGGLEEARSAIATALHDADRCRSRIAGADALVVVPPDAAPLDRLAARVARAQTAVQGGGPDVVTAEYDGFGAVEAELRAIAAEAHGAARANRAPLAERDELRGLLDAVTAKAAARGAADRGSVPSLLAGAREVLHTAPTDLVRARELVASALAALRDDDGEDRP